MGCPRSGTTLLQSLIASHSKVISFPETHLLSNTVPIHRLGQICKIYGSVSRNRLKETLIQLGLNKNAVSLPDHLIFSTSEWISYVLRNIDKLARSLSNSSITHWLEKTPRHLHYADLLETVNPEIRFIHIIRRGEQVVPSLYFATQDHPEEWDGARSLKKCVYWWNRSIGLSKSHLGKPNHQFVSYSQVTSDPAKVMKRICTFLDLDYEPSILDEFNQTADSLIQESEEWKHNNRSPDISASSKFERLTTQQQQYVKRNISDFPFDQIRI